MSKTGKFQLTPLIHGLPPLKGGVWRGNKGALSLVGIAPAEAHTACAKAFIFPSGKNKKIKKIIQVCWAKKRSLLQ